MTRRDPDRMAAIVADYKTGMPTRAIKAKYGVALSTIYLYASEAGVGRYGDASGHCAGCTAVRNLNADNLCRACVDDVPLRNGQWVYDRKRGVQVWELEDGAA